MKIGINLLPLRPGKNGGMEVYVRNLLSHLLAIDPVNEYFLITAPYNDTSINFPNINCKKILLHNEQTYSQKSRSLINKILGKANSPDISLERIIDTYHFDLWFCPFLSLDPRPLKIPSLVTIPDIQHEYYPENFSNIELSLRNEYIQPSCEMATAIITISEFSKKSFIEKLGIDPEKIHVVSLAAGDRFSNAPGTVDAVISKYDLPNEYFFYPANGWPHKNHLMLIMGFYLYRKSFDTSLHLVLSGSGLRETCDIPNLIAQYHLGKYVHILDYVDKDDLPGLYKNAKALVFPSLFEGFGIPLLEAMATGCPIIASNSTSIPEVAGDAAYLFEPKNPQSICDAMQKIVDDDGLREELIRNGKSRAPEYSYDKVARMHLDLFAAACAKVQTAKTAYLTQEKVIINGYYPDGWISRMEFRYRGPKKFRSARIDLIGGLPVRYPMKITIILNKKKKTRILIPALGKYSFEFEFSESGEEDTEYLLEIVPEKLYVPRKLAINNDEREIAVILDSLTLIDNTATSTQFIKKTI